jgi:ABC-2 type transport system ATP-binding protein
LFNAGRIALIGTIAELGRQVLGGGFALEIEADGGQAVARRLAAISGVSEVTGTAGAFRLLCVRDVRAEAAAEVIAAGGRLKRLSFDQPSLEAIYTRYFHDAGLEGEVRHAA